MLETSLCPCGSAEQYRHCCGPYHSQKQFAPTAESLMRSRYCAYVLGDESYLLASWHPSTRPLVLNLEDESHWLGLKVVASCAENDIEAWVEFVARYREAGRAQKLKERSRFVKESGRWYYIDGVVTDEATASGQKVGRNASCSCGSGRKYKRCCG